MPGEELGKRIVDNAKELPQDFKTGLGALVNTNIDFSAAAQAFKNAINAGSEHLLHHLSIGIASETQQDSAAKVASDLNNQNK